MKAPAPCRVLTGVKPTGLPHLGNYLGAIRPAIELANQSPQDTSLLFIADYHALTTIHEGKQLKELTYGVAATWLALGLDPQRTLIYRQSDVPEVFEIHWILSCFTSKGLMNRAHAYKAKVSENESLGRKDLDEGVSLGLFTYPTLMAADILSFQAAKVPVGEDQIQHIEIARDIAQRVNHVCQQDLFVLPQAVTSNEVKTIPGLDGRKMSKSYDNTIALFLESKKLRKMVMKIKTDSLPPEAPKDPQNSTLFDLYKLFATEEEIHALKKRYLEGIGWGHAKEALFEVIDRELSPKREIYHQLMSSPEKIESILQDGAQRARKLAQQTLTPLRASLLGHSSQL